MESDFQSFRDEVMFLVQRHFDLEERMLTGSLRGVTVNPRVRMCRADLFVRHLLAGRVGEY